MNGIRELPERVFKFIEEGVVSEFATVSKAGVPIDTPTYYFPSENMATIDVATGQSYPAKAERARRNPKVGLLMEGSAEEPVVAMRGMAAVRDANLQANAVRYISETGFSGIAFGLDWAGARKAVWYWTRIIVEVMPERIMWWDNPAAMDGPPHIWSAPAGTVFPQSDPKPPGETSPASQWKQRTWQEIAAGALSRPVGAHLTMLDEDGFPLSFRAREFELVGDRFRIIMPKGLPWTGTGTGTLTFEGIETFVGEVTRDGDTSWLAVERALPEHPLMKNPIEVLQPTDEIRGKLMARLEYETKRRGQPIPTIPEELPAPTRMAKLRQARIKRGVPITGINEARGNRG
jgi:hypothetical protein